MDLLANSRNKLLANSKGHVWIKDGDYIDLFQLDYGYHNGPRCIKCGYSFCMHCYHGVPEIECPVKEDE